MKNPLLVVYIFFSFNALYGQSANFKFVFKVNGLKPGSYPANVHLVTSVSRDSIIFSDTISVEKNIITVSGNISEEYLICSKSREQECLIVQSDRVIRHF